MSPTRGIIVVATIAALSFIAAPSDAQVRWVDYVVQEGDTCSSIALDAYGSEARYDLIHQANDLGQPPHELEPGETLRLPRVPEALLAQERGSVMLKSPEADWSRAAVGDELYRAWRLNTLARARALLSFRDASELILRENTLVVVYGGSADRTKRQPRARLESGALRARLGELAGGSDARVELETESASSITGEANVLVTVDEQQTSRVANHGGEAVAVEGRAGGKVAVDEGFGSQVDRGKPPAPPRPLPPTPTWAPGPTTFPSFDTATVRAAWAPVADATEYFVELTADARGIRVMESIYVPADVNALEVEGLEPGTYFATVSAIDGERFESIPSDRRPLEVVRFAFDPRGRVGSEPPSFVAGTAIAAPEQLKCAGAAEDGTLTIVARSAPVVEGRSYPGHEERQEVECQGTDGVPLTLEYVAVVPAFRVDADAVALPAGRAAGFDFIFDGPTLPLIASDDGIEGRLVPTSADRGRLRLQTPVDSTASAVVLRLGDTPLLRLPVEVNSVKAATAAPGPVWDIGAGAFATSGVRGITSAAGALATARVTAGLRASRYFRAGMMLDAGAAVSDPGAALFGLGFQATGQLPLGGVAPFLSVGFEGWFPTSGSPATSVGTYLGIDITLRETGGGARRTASGLRLYAGPSLFDVSDEFVIGVGGGAGYFWSF